MQMDSLEPPALVGCPELMFWASICILGLWVPLGVTHIFGPQLVCWRALGCGGGPSFPSEGSLQAPLQWDVSAGGLQGETPRQGAGQEG